MAAATLFARFLGFLYRLPLTDLIGDKGNALYGVGYQFYLFLLVLSSAGLPNAVSKMVSERIARGQYRNAHGVFRSAMTVAVIFGFIGTILLWIFAQNLAIRFGYPGSAYAIRAISPAVLIVAVMAVYRGYFQGMGNAAPTAVSQVVEQVFNAAFKLLLAYIIYRQLELGLEWAAAGAAAGTGVGALLGLLTVFLIYRRISHKIQYRIRREPYESDYYVSEHYESGFYEPERPRKLIKEVLCTAFPIILGAAIYSIANFIDMSMVSQRMGSSGVFTQTEIDALYGQLTGKFVVLTTLPVSISTALAITVLPSIAGSNITRDYKAVMVKITKALRLSALISIPAAVGISVMAEPILLLLFPNHPEGAILLQVGGVSIIFLSLVQVTAGALQGIGKIIIPVIGAGAGALAKIPLNYVLIVQPEINVLGAVISTIVCYFIAFVINLGVLKKYTRFHIDWIGTFFKPLIAAAVMGLTCFASYFILMAVTYENNFVSTFISVVLGMTVYFVVLIMIGGLDKDDVGKLPLIRRLVV